MVALNKVIIAGRLTSKPKLRKTPGGVSVTDLLIALNREYVTQAGDRQQEVCFVDVVVWSKEARKNNFYIYAVLSSSLALLQIFGN